MTPKNKATARTQWISQLDEFEARSGGRSEGSTGLLLRVATLALAITTGLCATQGDPAHGDDELATLTRGLKTNEGRQQLRIVVLEAKEGNAEELKKLLELVKLLKDNPVDEDARDDLSRIYDWGQKKVKELLAQSTSEPTGSGAKITKTFVDKGGKPVAGLTLVLTDAAGKQTKAETDERGKVIIPGDTQSIVAGGPRIKSTFLGHTQATSAQPVTVQRRPLDLAVVMNLPIALPYLQAKQLGLISRELAAALDPLIYAILQRVFGSNSEVQRAGADYGNKRLQMHYEVRPPEGEGRWSGESGLGGRGGGAGSGLGKLLGGLLEKDEIEKSTARKGSLGGILSGLLSDDRPTPPGDERQGGGLGGILGGLLSGSDDNGGPSDLGENGVRRGLGGILGGLIDGDEERSKATLKDALQKLLEADVETGKSYKPDTNDESTSSIAGAETSEPLGTNNAETIPNDLHFNAQGTWDGSYFDQWAIRRVGYRPVDDQLTSAWPHPHSEDIDTAELCVVAVIGSGVDWMHPDLFGRMWYNEDEIPDNGTDDDGNGFVDDFAGWNFIDKNDNIMDFGGHDTHVAGVIAARSGNGYGIAGINPWARVMAIKVADFRGETNSVVIARAISYAVKNGARVINISYGGPFSRVIAGAVADARSAGVLVVSSAGNQNQDVAQRGPAGCAGVITVSATDFNDRRIGSSNWGQPVDIAAPGRDILSVRARNTDFLLYVVEGNRNYQAGTRVVGKNRDLYRASGTSFAAPIVAGTASLIFSRRPELNADQVRRMLLMSARDLGQPGRDQYTGVGLLDAVQAIQADPDHFLFTRISKIALERQDGRLVVNVSGRVVANQLAGCWLQIGFGEQPDTWRTVSYNTQAVEGGILGTIPIAQFDRRGKWTIRILARDKLKHVRQARAVLNVN